MDAQFWIERLSLLPHPEGGHFRETYRSLDELPASALPARYGSERSCSTAIYFLLGPGERSRLHRLKSDELWHFHHGDPLRLSMISPLGELQSVVLGSDIERGETFQAVIPAGCWFGAMVENSRGYSLIGCTVAPGFHFDDFELADAQQLLDLYPQHHELIATLI